MKKLFALLMTFIFAFSLAGCGEKHEFLWPDETEISAVNLEKNGFSIGIKTPENITALSRLLKGDGRTTTTKSNPEKLPDTYSLLISVEYGDSSTGIYLTENNGKYYMEQAGAGIFPLTQEEFDTITGFYNGLKQPVSEMEKSSLTSEVKKLTPLDEHGESFKPADLSNDELLRYAFLQFGPKGNGFIDIKFDILSRTWIRGSFGIETATPADITCSCGQVIAVYNAANGTYTWDKTFHYADHTSDTFNEIKDMYKVEDRFYVELYKIFPDLMKNSSPQQYRFYDSYNDAENQTEPLFTVVNENEFTEAVTAMDNTGRPVYRLTFYRQGTLKLENYEIIG